MTGKVSVTSFWTWGRKSRTWNNHDVTLDYDKNNYDLSKSVYYASNINGEGKDFLLGSAFGKPIVNSAAAFALGLGFKVKLNGAKKGNSIQEAEDAINKWVTGNLSEIFDWGKHSFRDGDSYLYLDELGEMNEFDPNTVVVITDPLTGAVIGYNVEEKVYEEDPQLSSSPTSDPTYVILKEFRTDSIRFTKYESNDTNREKGSVIYEKVYTVDEGAVTPDDGQQFLPDQIQERPLPVIHIANEPEARAIYGNSDYQSSYIFMKEYHTALKSGLQGVSYNNTPIPWLKGVKSKGGLVNASQEDGDATGKDKNRLEWGQDTVLYLEGQNADAGFLQSKGVMEDTAKALEVLFYNILETSETPEFVFGAAVTSSKASTETQMPVVIQKAERKRRALEKPLKSMIQTYIDRRVRMSDPVFLNIRDVTNDDITLDFPPLIDEDRKLTLDIVKLLVEQGLISNRTTLELLLSTRIPDIDEELEQAQEDAKEFSDTNNILPDERQRLLDALNNDGGDNDDDTNEDNPPEED